MERTDPQTDEKDWHQDRLRRLVIIQMERTGTQIDGED